MLFCEKDQVKHMEFILYFKENFCFFKKHKKRLSQE